MFYFFTIQLVKMRSFTTTMMACLVIATTNSQFNDGQGNFFTFNTGPTAQSAPAFRPQQQQLEHVQPTWKQFFCLPSFLEPSSFSTSFHQPTPKTLLIVLYVTLNCCLRGLNLIKFRCMTLLA